MTACDKLGAGAYGSCVKQLFRKLFNNARNIKLSSEEKGLCDNLTLFGDPWECIWQIVKKPVLNNFYCAIGGMLVGKEVPASEFVEINPTCCIGTTIDGIVFRGAVLSAEHKHKILTQGSELANLIIKLIEIGNECATAIVERHLWDDIKVDGTEFDLGSSVSLREAMEAKRVRYEGNADFADAIGDFKKSLAEYVEACDDLNSIALQECLIVAAKPIIAESA
jgi:hypothetical protein